MPGNRKLQRNGSATDRVEEVMGRLKIETADDNDNGREADEQQGAYPERPGEADCLYYLRTRSCGYGSSCRFNHPPIAGQLHGVKNTNELPERAGQPDCGHYLKTGTCKYGSTCKYNHPKNRQTDSLVMMNILGLPMRQDAKPCTYYMRTGSCNYGYACKFHHPQPASAANVLPIVGPAYGSVGSAVVPSSVAPTLGEFPASSLPRATYYPSPLQLPQTYMPLFLSPSPGWNTYTGNATSLSDTSALTAPISNGHFPYSYLPERPDQPECRHFMNNGSCKYGPNCKYHHPREKLLQLATSSVGPLGLPLRPGQPICLYYSHYGLCKYGPTCGFDHPLNGYAYPYPYSLSIPHLVSPDVFPAPNQKTGLPVPSSEASHSKSSNLSEWMSKGETADDKNEHITKSLEDSPNSSDSLPHSSEPSSEVIQEESDSHALAN